MSDTPKLPRPIRITRKLSLAKESLATLETPQEAAAPRCTQRRTGCPAHTC